MTRPAMQPRTHPEWVHARCAVVDKAVSMLAELVEELGPGLALSRRSPEYGPVVNLLALARDAGGSVALDAVRTRLRRRLVEELERDELATVMGDLGSRIRDVVGGA